MIVFSTNYTKTIGYTFTRKITLILIANCNKIKLKISYRCIFRNIKLKSIEHLEKNLKILTLREAKF